MTSQHRRAYLITLVVAVVALLGSAGWAAAQVLTSGASGPFATSDNAIGPRDQYWGGDGYGQGNPGWGDRGSAQDWGPGMMGGALAIQLIINNEWGPAFCENPQQGSYLIEHLTDLVEEAVLAEFDRLTDRGGVLGAMETGYQRGRIQDESLLYESRKHDGSLPIVGVNMFRAPEGQEQGTGEVELMRATEAEKESQLRRLADFHARHADDAPPALERLRRVAAEGGNTFEVLMDAVRVCSLGQITQAFFEVGGQYRRNM